MELFSKLNNLFCPAHLSWRRIIFAIAIAVAADLLQVPLQVPPLPQIIDVVMMVLTSAAIGFHLLLLPTFAVEFIPGVDMLPTWTGCVLAVIALRKRSQNNTPPVPSPANPSLLEPQKRSALPPQKPPDVS